MNTNLEQLCVTIKKVPHWRVLVRPTSHDPQRLQTLRECRQLVEKHRVSFRGWDFPHLSHREDEVGAGLNWYEGGSDFWSHREYWRLYQSGQFIHFHEVREFSDKSWDAKLRGNAHFQLHGPAGVDTAQARGYVDIINVLYTITEYFEFARRLATAAKLEGVIDMEVGLFNATGFVLTADVRRAWHGYFECKHAELNHKLSVKIVDLIANQKQYVMDHLAWLFERFGWLDFQASVFGEDYDNFIAGKA